jgi:hypothetical protein
MLYWSGKHGSSALYKQIILVQTIQRGGDRFGQRRKIENCRECKIRGSLWIFRSAASASFCTTYVAVGK